ncbi:hypothetical protein [Streptomyces sp. NPDC059708]|uniref:hypothetical protein n=1 Tax=Streptomyces sp. NPDC059708 TaxID=3346916 RepID=UPI0036995911
MTSRREAPHHNTLYCVKQFGCRRLECLVRNSEYTQRRYRRVAYGTWQPFMDAEPVRRHVEQLRAAGVGTVPIAAAAGVSTATIARILYGKQGQRANARIRTESAQAILAVSIEDCRIPDGARIDGTGTRRRLQALVAAGWSFTALASEIGIHAHCLGDMARAANLTAGNARRVKVAYRRLLQTTPAQLGVTSQAQALARRVANRENWHGPLAWDDTTIDDPTAQPETSEPYQPPARNGRDSMRMTELEHLLALGESEAAIAKQMGSSEDYIHDLAIVLRNRKTADSNDTRKAA